MKSKIAFIGVFLVAVLLSTSSVYAIIVCHDYVFWRVTGHDPSVPQLGYKPGAVTIMPHPYKKITCRGKVEKVSQFDKRPADTTTHMDDVGLRRLLEAYHYVPRTYPLSLLTSNDGLYRTVLKEGDVIIVSTDHSGIVNSRGNIDHFKQFPANADGSDSHTMEYYDVSELPHDAFCTYDGNQTVKEERCCCGGLMMNDEPKMFVERSCPKTILPERIVVLHKDTRAVDFEVTPSTGGTISVTYGQEIHNPPRMYVISNNYFTFKVVSSTGYEIDQVTGCGSTATAVGEYKTDAIGSTCKITVKMKKKKFKVSASSSCKQSDGSDCGTISPLSQDVKYKETGSITVTPAEGYKVSGASASGCGITTGTSVTPIIQTGEITDDCNVTVDFALKTYTVTSRITGGGNIDKPSETVTHKKTVTFRITPNPDNHIQSVDGCGDGVASAKKDSYTTGEITGDCVVKVVFAKDSYQLDILAAPTKGVVKQTVSFTAKLTVDAGDEDAVRYNYQWRVGGQLKGNVTSDQTTHTFDKPDKYIVEVVVQKSKSGTWREVARKSVTFEVEARTCTWRECPCQWLAHTCKGRAITGTSRDFCEKSGGTYWHTNGHCGIGSCDFSKICPMPGHFCCQ